MQNFNTQPQYVSADVGVVRSVMQQVYLWMTLALLITASVAGIVSTTSIVDSIAANPLLLIGVIVLQLGLVFYISARISRLAPSTAIGLFLLYSAVMGITMSFIVLTYTAESIAGAFVSTAATFGAMSIYGMTTKADLTKLGHYLFMALIGLIITMVVNIFLGSSTLGFLISLAGVIIFTGLTAYDTQKISRMAAVVGGRGDSAMITRIAIMGALTLYLDFINLFLFILRLMGSRR